MTASRRWCRCLAAAVIAATRRGRCARWRPVHRRLARRARRDRVTGAAVERHGWSAAFAATEVVGAFAAAYVHRALPRSAVVAARLDDARLVEADAQPGPVRMAG